MTALDRVGRRVKAAGAELASRRPLRAVVGAAVAPALLLAALHLLGTPWEAYLLEAAVAAASVAGAVIGWLSMQDTPNVVKLEADGELVRDPSPYDDSRCDVEALGETLDDLQDAHEDDDKPAQAVVLELDSPGGPVGASCELHDALDDFDGRSVAVVDDYCASGGYMAASACDRVLVRRHTIVGSIGVAGSTLNYHQLLEDHGIAYEGVTAGDHKDAGHPAAETDDEERAYRQDLIDRFMDDFVERVTAGRPALDEERVRDLEGGVLIGEDAVDAGLVDAIGDEDDAREWLIDELDLDVDEADDLDLTTTRSVRPTTGLPAASLAERVAYATGQGIASVLADRVPDPELSLEFRFRP